MNSNSIEIISIIGGFIVLLLVFGYCCWLKIKSFCKNRKRIMKANFSTKNKFGLNLNSKKIKQSFGNRKSDKRE